MKIRIMIIMSAVLILIGVFAVVNRVSPVSWGMWGAYNTSSDIAIQGYDPVAYFVDGQPTMGDEQYTQQWGDASWQFASAENKALFAKDPMSFAPQFGGFCAFAVGKGFTADISPEAWHIEDGNLYLFADKKVRDEWVAGLDDGSLEGSTENWAQR